MPKIISTTPPNNSQNVSSVEPIVFFFDIPVETSKLTIKSQPEANWQLTQTAENVITAKSTKYLSYSKEYFFEIIYSTNKIGALNFKTAAGQGDPQFYQEVKDVMSRDYPLAEKFPYLTDNYKVVYSAPLELEIRLKANTLSEQEAIDAIKSYVTKNGGDASVHKYVVVPLSQ